MTAPRSNQATPYDWTGPYLGVQLEYGWGIADGDACSIGPGFLVCDPFSTGLDGALGGIHVGNNIALGNGLIFGIEADLQAANVSGWAPYGLLVLDPDAFYIDLKWQASLRGRLGYAVDRTLIYATAGFAHAELDYSVGYARTGPERTHRKSAAGWTVGAGVEQAFADQFTARIEYRYSDFGDLEHISGVHRTLDRYNLSQHAVRVGLSYKF